MAYEVNEAMLNAAVSRFLKNVSQAAEQEIAKKLRSAIASGKIRDHDAFTAAVNFSAEKVDLNVTIYTRMDLS